MNLPVPCLTCGESTTHGSRCEPCSGTHSTIRTAGKKWGKQNTTARGYGHDWQKLSERARRLQPFCEDCGTSEDLQTDHSPTAWRRRDQGLPIRLQDVAVVCGPCNRTRGQARLTTSPPKRSNTLNPYRSTRGGS